MLHAAFEFIEKLFYRVNVCSCHSLPESGSFNLNIVANMGELV